MRAKKCGGSTALLVLRAIKVNGNVVIRRPQVPGSNWNYSSDKNQYSVCAPVLVLQAKARIRFKVNISIPGCYSLDRGRRSPYRVLIVVYIRISDKHDARGFLLLAKSGMAVTCLPHNIYGVSPEHVKLLKRKQIPFRKLSSKNVRLPKSILAA